MRVVCWRCESEGYIKDELGHDVDCPVCDGVGHIDLELAMDEHEIAPGMLFTPKGTNDVYLVKESRCYNRDKEEDRCAFYSCSYGRGNDCFRGQDLPTLGQCKDWRRKDGKNVIFINISKLSIAARIRVLEEVFG